MADGILCNIDGCGNPAKVRGWCGKHYARYWRHGDATVNLTNQGKPLPFLRAALGTVDDACLTWPFDRSAKGYGRYHEDGKRVAAHRKMCELAHGPAPTPQHSAAHSCGKGHEGCVNPRHLRWATSKENHADKFIHGTIARGERNGNASMSESTARGVKSMLGNATQREIAAIYGVTRSAVRDIKIGRSWGWI